MTLSEINIREKKFHDKLQTGEGYRKENIFYKALFNLFKDFNNYLNQNVKDKIVLDYGCGVGSLTEKIAKGQPEKIIGIDISNVTIEKAILKAKEANLDIEYKVDNCENSSLNSNSFDIIFGSGILHHLNLSLSVKEISRLLKKNGEMIFIEPLGTNPIINLYRKLTPNSRSKDEHPFLKEDFIFLKNTYKDVKVKYYGFFTLIFFPFYKDPENSKIYKILSCVDSYLFKLSFFKSLAWSALIICKK
tara:strand:- start:4039 stop:4779 length:741 start_codon:yes stop_codon:yes gene_type:complete